MGWSTKFPTQTKYVAVINGSNLLIDEKGHTSTASMGYKLGQIVVLLFRRTQIDIAVHLFVHSKNVLQLK